MPMFQPPKRKSVEHAIADGGPLATGAGHHEKDSESVQAEREMVVPESLI